MSYHGHIKSQLYARLRLLFFKILPYTLTAKSKSQGINDVSLKNWEWFSLECHAPPPPAAQKEMR